MAKEYDTTLARQTLAFQNSESTFETALDGMSDDSFVLTAPAAGYGYVVNILIPFSTTQANELKNADADFGDPKGNKFAKRAELLEGVRGTDQRGSWITGATDYSFDGASVGDKYTGGNAARRGASFAQPREDQRVAGELCRKGLERKIFPDMGDGGRSIRLRPEIEPHAQFKEDLGHAGRRTEDLEWNVVFIRHRVWIPFGRSS